MRIGVMTGGGDCPGLNAAIRAVVRSASARHGAEVLGIHNGYEGLINQDYRVLSLSEVRGIIRVGGTILGASNRTDPFNYPEPGTGKIIDASDRAAATVRDLALDALVVIGGDGTLILSSLFAERFDIPIVGIPKTIDNDVRGTDYAIGFDTAVTIATEALDRLHTTAESHHRVMLVEVMGRTAGWIALYSGIAGGADVILIPERHYSINGIIEAIERRRRADSHFTIAAVAEGIRGPGGTRVYRARAGVEHQWKLGGVCGALEAVLRDSTHQEVRSLVLGHLQRGGTPTAFDRTLATALGAKAIDLIMHGQTQRLVGMSGGSIVDMELHVAAGGPRLVPVDHDLIEAADAMGVYIGDSQ